MKKIDKKSDADNDLTVFTVIGKVAANELLTTISDFYKSAVTANVLWNLTQSDLSEISTTDVKSIATLSIEYAGKRSSGKTAIVGSDDLAYGLSRMYETFKGTAKLPFETRAFRDVDDAYKWLFSD